VLDTGTGFFKLTCDFTGSSWPLPDLSLHPCNIKSVTISGCCSSPSPPHLSLQI